VKSSSHVCGIRAVPQDGSAYSPDGRTLATAGEDGTIPLWDPAAGKKTRQP